MLDERHNPLPSRPHDDNAYTFCRIGDHNVIACLPSGVTGTTSAAIVAPRMISTFDSLRFDVMVGIGGGVPSQGNDIRLGDVVVNKPTATFPGVIQSDFGKTVQDGHFTRTGSLNRPPDALLGAVSNLQAKHKATSYRNTYQRWWRDTQRCKANLHIRLRRMTNYSSQNTTIREKMPRARVAMSADRSIDPPSPP